MNTYMVIGFFTGGIIFSAGFIIPFVVYLIYKGRAFVNDDKNYDDDKAAEKSLGMLRLPFLDFFDDFNIRFFVCMASSVFAFFVWPLMILAAAVYMFMLFLRLTKRLQKHTTDKDAHK